MTKRDQVRLNITPETSVVLDRLCDRFGMTKQELATRIYRWFSEQDEIVQTSVLDLLPESVELHAAEVYMEQVKARRAEHREPRGKGKRDPK